MFRGLRGFRVRVGIEWDRAPKTRGTILRVPVVRSLIYWGLYWGPIIQGNYHMWVV